MYAGCSAGSEPVSEGEGGEHGKMEGAEGFKMDGGQKTVGASEGGARKEGAEGNIEEGGREESKEKEAGERNDGGKAVGSQRGVLQGRREVRWRELRWWRRGKKDGEGAKVEGAKKEGGRNLKEGEKPTDATKQINLQWLAEQGATANSKENALPGGARMASATKYYYEAEERGRCRFCSRRD
ncbi:hypothetical protein BC830DRAFT_1217710 [Chytriomyces sp. MP71]|nr:hypothetical protein BC830DRAFT_1217710 [Chytriomyces sp. MP71]